MRPMVQYTASVWRVMAAVWARTAWIGACAVAGNVRIDTHRDNQPMQALLKKCGFAYCGRIFLADGSERIAFQKTL